MFGAICKPGRKTRREAASKDFTYFSPWKTHFIFVFRPQRDRGVRFPSHARQAVIQWDWPRRSSPWQRMCAIPAKTFTLHSVKHGCTARPPVVARHPSEFSSALPRAPAPAGGEPRVAGRVRVLFDTRWSFAGLRSLARGFCLRESSHLMLFARPCAKAFAAPRPPRPESANSTPAAARNSG